MHEALQQAVYTALTGDATLSAAVAGIYDKRPQAADGSLSTDYPAVTIGDGSVGQFSTDDWSGGDASIEVHVWSRYDGNREALQIMDMIRNVLDRGSLTISGRTHVTTDFQNAFVDADPDGETRHGVIEFSVLVR